MIFYLLFTGCSSSATDTSSTKEEPAHEPSYEDSGDTHLIPFHGTVFYEDGTEVTSANTRVQMCSDYCYPAIIGSDGNFAFIGLAPSTYAFDVVPLGENATTYATPLDFISLTEDMESHSLTNTVKIPTFSTIQDLTESELVIDNQLFITVHPDSYTPREGFDSSEYVAGTSIPDDSGLILEGIQGNFIVGWYLGAFEAKVGDWPFRVENLTPGTSIHAYNSSYDDKEWVSLGTATVDENGVFMAPSGLKILSGVILMQE